MTVESAGGATARLRREVSRSPASLDRTPTPSWADGPWRSPASSATEIAVEASGDRLRLVSSITVSRSQASRPRTDRPSRATTRTEPVFEPGGNEDDVGHGGRRPRTVLVARQHERRAVRACSCEAHGRPRDPSSRRARTSADRAAIAPSASRGSQTFALSASPLPSRRPAPGSRAASDTKGDRHEAGDPSARRSSPAHVMLEAECRRAPPGTTRAESSPPPTISRPEPVDRSRPSSSTPACSRTCVDRPPSRLKKLRGDVLEQHSLLLAELDCSCPRSDLRQLLGRPSTRSPTMLAWI